MIVAGFSFIAISLDAAESAVTTAIDDESRLILTASEQSTIDTTIRLESPINLEDTNE